MPIDMISVDACQILNLKDSGLYFQNHKYFEGFNNHPKPSLRCKVTQTCTMQPYASETILLFKEFCTMLICS